jgi:hypothetical protein
MKASNTPLSFHVIYWTMNVLLVLSGLIFTIVVIVYGLLWTDFFGNDMQLHIDLPGKINYLEEGLLHMNNSYVNIELVEASAKVHFINTPAYLARYFVLILLGVLSLGMFMLWTFRQIVVNVRRGKIFIVDNIILLQRISYSLVAFWFVIILYRRLAYHYVTQNIHMESIEIVDNFDTYGGMLIAALFIWVLSHIFLKGLKLQQEQDLTV